MSYELVSESTPKGRNDYYCEWCNEKIPRGEKHYQRSYKFEGDFHNGRMHNECKEAMEKAPHDLVCEGWIQGDFRRGSCD